MIRDFLLALVFLLISWSIVLLIMQLGDGK